MLQETLSDQDKADLILCLYNWFVHQSIIELRSGMLQSSNGEVSSIVDPDPTLKDRLAESVRTKDESRALRIGVAEAVSGLKRIQSEVTGPKLNAFYRRHLNDRVFRLLYSAAGLDPNRVAYDHAFPVELLDLNDL